MMTRLLLIGLLLLPALVLGQSVTPRVQEPEDNSLEMNQQAVEYQSEEADFWVMFPVGCSKIVAKVPSDFPEDENGDPLPVTYISYCDRFQEKGEGCSVTTYFNVRGEDDGPAGPQEVSERVKRMLGTMGVKIQQQKPLRRELADGTLIEGLDVLAAEPGGVGESWVRGLLYQGDIYLLTAWKSDGNLAMDPDYITFFNSFRPLTN